MQYNIHQGYNLKQSNNTTTRNFLSLRSLEIVLGIIALLSTIILTLTVISVISQGDMFITTGSEGPGIYAIWKAQNGYPLYEMPDRPLFHTSLYNYIFTYLYAAILSIFSLHNATMMIGGKILTLFFALGGVVSYWFLLRQLMPRWATDRRFNLYLMLFSFVTWIGGNNVSSIISIRPDIPAATLATLALAFLVRGLNQNNNFWIVMASFFFYLTWGMKESYVISLVAATCFLLLYKHNWKQAMLLIAPCVGLVGISLLVGDEAYRFNQLIAPSVNAFELKTSITILITTFIRCLFALGFLIYLPVLYKSPKNFLAALLGKDKPQTANQDDFIYSPSFVLFIYITGISLPICFYISGKEGAATNYYLEAYFAAMALTLLTFSTLYFNRASQPRFKLYLIIQLLLLASLLVIPVSRVISPYGSDQWIQPYGHIFLGTDEQYKRVKKFSQYLQTLPKPILIYEDVMEQPWNSNAGAYPATVIDRTYYETAKDKGLLKNDGLLDLIGKRYYGTLLIQKDNMENYQAALAAGYKLEALPSEFDIWGLRLLK